MEYFCVYTLITVYSFVPYILSAEPCGDREIQVCAAANPGVSRFGQFNLHSNVMYIIHIPA